jgi:hypothetical protein
MTLPPHEVAELYLLAVDAWEARGTDCFDAAVERIGEWIDRRDYARCKRWIEWRAEDRQRRNERLCELLRQTDPHNLRRDA